MTAGGRVSCPKGTRDVVDRLFSSLAEVEAHNARVRQRSARTAELTNGGAVVPEAQILSAVLQAIKLHPRVGWAHRFNTGGAHYGEQYVAFGFAGLSDILGQLKDGRFLAIEVKRAGKVPTEGQVEFMGKVARFNGVAFVARSIDDAMAGIDKACG
jgi:hypothetical protein